MCFRVMGGLLSDHEKQEAPKSKEDARHDRSRAGGAKKRSPTRPAPVKKIRSNDLVPRGVVIGSVVTSTTVWGTTWVRVALNVYFDVAKEIVYISERFRERNTGDECQNTYDYMLPDELAHLIARLSVLDVVYHIKWLHPNFETKDEFLLRKFLRLLDKWRWNPQDWIDDELNEKARAICQSNLKSSCPTSTLA